MGRRNNLEKDIIEAISEYNGEEDDINLLDAVLIEETAKKLTKRGKMFRKSNEILYVAHENFIKDKFQAGLNNDTFFLLGNEKKEERIGKEHIHFIKCYPDNVENTLKQIDERGFLSVPSSLIFGLGIHFPETVKKYRKIISLSQENHFSLDFSHVGLPKLGFLGLKGDPSNKLPVPCLLSEKQKEIGFEWWHVVTPKPNK